MQRTFTDGDFIFTEHNLDTKDDEAQDKEKKAAKAGAGPASNVE